jgi:hypothetical protein
MQEDIAEELCVVVHICDGCLLDGGGEFPQGSEGGFGFVGEEGFFG